MSTLEETRSDVRLNIVAKKDTGQSYVVRLLNLLGSVRFGIVLLILLGALCVIGMVIMQQNVEGFDHYYAQLTPSQKLVYGKLGLFDIYHSWYFITLFLILSLNIILASIDRFPKTWTFISKPKTDASPRWLLCQRQHAKMCLYGKRRQDLVQQIERTIRSAGWKKTVVSEKGGQTFVFGQSGAWNRLGAYAVHIALMTIFLGGFLSSQLGHTGQMSLSPGQTSSSMFETAFDLDRLKQNTKQLPFEVTCTDIEQKLIRKEESISVSNTIDWLTRIRIKDETGSHDAIVQMNRPFDYRGYRFFQASFTSVGRARNITLSLKPAGGGPGQNVFIPRDGETTLPDGTKIKFAEFRGNFSIGEEDLNEDTSNYPNPAAILRVTTPNGESQTAYAFGPQMADMPVASKSVGGYTFHLIDFEKVSDQHILAIQRDPGATIVYIGFALLAITLAMVFFFSHQRVWAVVEEKAENNFEVVLGGNTNRNQVAFNEKFKRMVHVLRQTNKEIR